MVVAASRNSAAARLEDLRVREEITLPPEILFPGARHSQEVKCLALGHARRTPRTAVEHLGLVGVVEFQRLGQREDMFISIIAHQCRADRLDGGVATHIAVRCQHVGIALARNNGPDNPHPGRTGDVRDDVVKL